jgi:hypothetical protein
MRDCLQVDSPLCPVGYFQCSARSPLSFCHAQLHAESVFPSRTSVGHKELSNV